MYKFKFTVTDTETDEHVIGDWTTFDAEHIGQFGDCEAVDIHVGSALRFLRRYAARKSFTES